MDKQQLRWVQETFKTGHFWNPDSKNLWNIKYEDLGLLAFDSEHVRRAIESRTRFQINPYAHFVVQAHNRIPIFDGLEGPAVKDLLNLERCWVPDYAPPLGIDFKFPDDPHLEEVCKQMQADLEQPAVGTGNWARCHGIGEFHSAIVNVNRSGIGAHLVPVFIKVLRNVQKSYAEFGQWFVFVENGIDLLTGETHNETPNIDFSFVTRSSGWIGLAIVGKNQGCSSRIWCKYLSSYQGGDVVNQWTTLIKHEIGHNTGQGHTSGGVMNSSIVRGLPIIVPPSDPSYQYWKTQFGGEIVGGDIPPPPPPIPPNTLEDRVKQLEAKQTVNDARLEVYSILIQYLLQR